MCDVSLSLFPPIPILKEAVLVAWPAEIITPITLVQVP